MAQRKGLAGVYSDEARRPELVQHLHQPASGNFLLGIQFS